MILRKGFLAAFLMAATVSCFLVCNKIVVRVIISFSIVILNINTCINLMANPHHHCTHDIQHSAGETGAHLLSVCPGPVKQVIRSILPADHRLLAPS